LICLALALVTIGVYWQVHGFDFVNYDDPDYVTENAMVKSGVTLEGIAWAFTHSHAGNWHPLTWISHMVDCQLFGLHAGGPHLVNVLFHAANAILLFLLLQRMTGAQGRSAIVAGLFALHPLHVESVAWIAERKDVLSTFLGLLSLHAYVSYVQRLLQERFASAQPAEAKSKFEYWLALIFFALSLMAKPMLVTLPFVLLLLDYWPLSRIAHVGWRTLGTRQAGRLVLEKWPWFALAAALSVVTFFVQKGAGAVLGIEHFPFSWRLANAVTSYFDYILKAFWPVHLTVFYPLAHGQAAGQLILALGFLCIVSLAVVTVGRPPLLVGWLWYLGTLVPVIGLVQVGGQAMADRYTYFPLIGIFIGLVWTGAEWMQRVKVLRIFGGATCAIVLGLLAAVTVAQLQYWRDSLALFNHALAVSRDNALANNNLGSALARIGRPQEALEHYQEAVRIDPDNARYQDNLATALVRAGQPGAAVDHYVAAIRDDPGFAEAYSNLGALFLAAHHVNEAITNLDKAVKIDPDNAELRSNLGNALSAAGKLDEALEQHTLAIRLAPADATIRLNAGLALMKAGKMKEAATQFAEAVRLDPGSAEARFELGRQLFFEGQFPAAIEQLREAAKLRSNYAVAEFYQAAALAELGGYDEASAVAMRALGAAQQSGQTGLAARIQEALQSFNAKQPYRPKAPGGN